MNHDAETDMTPMSAKLVSPCINVERPAPMRAPHKASLIAPSPNPPASHVTRRRDARVGLYKPTRTLWSLEA